VPPRTSLRTDAPRPAGKGSLDRAAVRDAALRLFADRGYVATTMDDLGAALGVRGPSLYKHVRSKYDLLLDICSTAFETLLAEQRALLASPGSPPELLWRLVNALGRFHAERGLEAVVGRREIGNLEPVDRMRLHTLWETYEYGLRSVIEQGRATGAFKAESAMLASFMIIDGVMGIGAWYRLVGPLAPDEVAAAYADQALALLSAKRPRSHRSAATVRRPPTPGGSRTAS
jgi:AcrR family transcriptional regulator